MLEKKNKTLNRKINVVVLCCFFNLKILVQTKSDPLAFMLISSAAAVIVYR